MKIKINVEDKEQEFDLKLRGRDIKELWKKFIAGQEALQKEDGSKMLEYMDGRDELIANLIGWKIDQLDNLLIEEKQKLTSAVEEKVQGDLSFTRPS